MYTLGVVQDALFKISAQRKFFILRKYVTKTLNDNWWWWWWW
jgi:hypothetical protein